MTRCRLYIDEVGNGGLFPTSDIPNERFLALTGIITRIDIYDRRFVPEVAVFKDGIFGSGGRDIVLHRREILRRENDFACLMDSDKSARFDQGLLTLFRDLPYIASTVAIDKKQYIELYGEWKRDPYHFCLQELIERYVFWMHRHDYVGDVVIEARGPKPDRKVKEAFHNIYDSGTGNIKARIVQKHLTSREIKFAIKPDNCPAMQIVDLLAHPSLRAMRFERDQLPLPTDYGTKVVDILERWKYARHPRTKIKDGWGKKWLPK